MTSKVWSRFVLYKVLLSFDKKAFFLSWRESIQTISSIVYLLRVRLNRRSIDQRSRIQTFGSVDQIGDPYFNFLAEIFLRFDKPKKKDEFKFEKNVFHRYILAFNEVVNFFTLIYVVYCLKGLNYCKSHYFSYSMPCRIWILIDTCFQLFYRLDI